MIAGRFSRRAAILGSGGLAATHVLQAPVAMGQGAAPKGYVLGPSKGEQLILRGGNIFIKADPATGSNGLAMGTQQVLAGVGIPIHRHFKMDEAFYVLDGSGTFILEDVSHTLETGSAIFIPKNAWHGFANPDHELLLLWVVAPPGLEAFFRDVATRPGVPAIQRTKQQLNDIARRYDTEFR